MVNLAHTALASDSRTVHRHQHDHEEHGRKVARAYDVLSLPTTRIVDPDGLLAGDIPMGNLEREDLERRLASSRDASKRDHPPRRGRGQGSPQVIDTLHLISARRFDLLERRVIA
jgi:hypothetical protein